MTPAIIKRIKAGQTLSIMKLSCSNSRFEAWLDEDFLVVASGCGSTVEEAIRNLTSIIDGEENQ
jgi:F420-0:gamma-glutamyl ligase